MRWEEGSRPVPGQVINPSPFFFYTHQKNVVVFQNPKNTYFFSLLFMLYSKEHRTQKIQIQIHHQFLFSYKLVGESPFSPTKLLPNKTFGVWILCPIRDNLKLSGRIETRHKCGTADISALSSHIGFK